VAETKEIRVWEEYVGESGRHSRGLRPSRAYCPEGSGNPEEEDGFPRIKSGAGLVKSGMTITERGFSIFYLDNFKLY
jgi:hypothetical protein